MLLPNTPLQRTRVAPRPSPLNGRPLAACFSELDRGPSLWRVLCVLFQESQEQ